MSNNHRISSSNGTQACAACKYQRRKCAPDCILAPYFPHDRQRQFTNAHKLFGVSNITKIIKNLNQPQKDIAMRTIIYQSDVRAEDPVGGCLRIIRDLHYQIEYCKAELDLVLQQLAVCRAQAAYQQQNNCNSASDEVQIMPPPPPPPPPPLATLEASPVDDDQINGDVIQASDPLASYNNNNNNDDGNNVLLDTSGCGDDNQGLNVQNYAQVVHDYQYLLAMQDSILGSSSDGCNTRWNNNDNNVVEDADHHDNQCGDVKPQINVSVYGGDEGIYRFDQAADESCQQDGGLLKFDPQPTTEESDGVILKEGKVVDEEQHALQHQLAKHDRRRHANCLFELTN